MSRIQLAFAVPHDFSNGFPKPKVFLSSFPMGGFNVDGKDLLGAKWQNGNVKKGYKNRFEYGVTTQSGVTKLQLNINTSMWLPPVNWTLIGDKPVPKPEKKASVEEGKEKKLKGKRRSSRGSETSNDRSDSGDEAKLITPQTHHHYHYDERNDRERRIRRPQPDDDFEPPEFREHVRRIEDVVRERERHHTRHGQRERHHR